MLAEEAIRSALHANKVLPLGVANPHGPLGLEQLAAAIAAHQEAAQPNSHRSGVRRPIELAVQTWEKLHALAAASSQARTALVTAGELAATIIEQYMFDAAL